MLTAIAFPIRSDEIDGTDTHAAVIFDGNEVVDYRYGPTVEAAEELARTGFKVESIERVTTEQADERLA